MKRFFPAVCLVAVFSLLLNAIWLSPAAAATVPQIAWLEEWSGGDLVNPRAIDVDGQGNLYVADQVARAVFKYDRYGRTVGTYLGGEASGKGVAVTADGRTLYVSTRSQGVAMIDLSTGATTGYLSGVVPEAPGEIDLDADGYIFVTDLKKLDIKIYFPNGTYKAKFGGTGIANGQFKFIAALTVDANAAKVYVGSKVAELPRLQVFDKNGVFLANVTNAFLYGTDNHTARGLAFEEKADGRAYLLRGFPAALRVFDGALTKLLGDFGALSGKLSEPVDVAYDPMTQRLFVSDGSGIDVFGIDGATSPVRTNSLPTSPVVVSPVAGTAVASITPALHWVASTDADGDALTYQVVVKQGDATVYTTTTTATTVTLPTGLLAENGAYAWTVQASDGQGASPASPAAFVVNALDEAPAAPVAVAPLSGETLDDAGVLTWTAAGDPDPNDTLLAYRLEIATDSAFAQPLLSETFAGTSVALSGLAGYADLEVGTAYFWRVIALDADGTASAPSATGSFAYDVMLLKVTANVADASVYLHGNHGFAGQFVGVAPLELRNLPAGTFSVVVERPGFEPYIAQVTLVEGASSAVAANLLPAYTQATFVDGTINGKAGIAVSANATPFLVDFDNDGRLDLLVGDAAGQVTIFPVLALPAAGQVTVQPPRALGLPVLPGAVPFVADWDNDGRKDLLVGVADGSVKLFLNVGTETAPVFGSGQDLAVDGSVLNVGASAAPVVVDLDGDGAKDLVVANGAGRVAAFYNQASDAAPQLAAGVELFKAAAAVQLAVVDWDADGDRDLLATAGGVPVVYRNDRPLANSFTAAGKLPVKGVFAVAAADLNGGTGKDLLFGKDGGKLLFQAGAARLYTATTMTYLLASWDDSSALVAAENPAALAQAATVRTELVAGNYAASRQSALALAGMLAAGGDARAAVEAFAALLK